MPARRLAVLVGTALILALLAPAVAPAVAPAAQAAPAAGGDRRVLEGYGALAVVRAAG